VFRRIGDLAVVVRRMLADHFAWALLISAMSMLPAGVLQAQSLQPEPSGNKLSVYRIKYVSDASLYIDAGRNADLQEGMKLSLINPPPDGAASDGVRFRGYEHIAELRVISVADASAVCEIVSANGEIKVGQLAWLPESRKKRPKMMKRPKT